VARQAPPILTYTIATAAPVRVQETLSVFADGSLWYWSLSAAAEASRNRAGTFTCALEAAEVATARDLAAALVALPPGVATEQRDDLLVTVAARADEAERTTVLSYGRQTADHAALAGAREHLQTLLARAEPHPLSVVRLSLGSMPGPSSLGLSGTEAPTVRFIFESIGSKAVAFQLRRDAFALYARTGEGWQRRWRSGADRAMTLVSPDARLVDGIYAPARLRPGGTAAAAVLGSALPSGAGETLLQGLVEGTLAVLEPHAAPEKVPHHPFSLQSLPHDTSTVGGATGGTLL
jgi:hypothetical protein